MLQKIVKRFEKKDDQGIIQTSKQIANVTPRECVGSMPLNDKNDSQIQITKKCSLNAKSIKNYFRNDEPSGFNLQNKNANLEQNKT